MEDEEERVFHPETKPYPEFERSHGFGLAFPDFVEKSPVLPGHVTLHAARVVRVQLIKMHVPNEVGGERNGVGAALESSVQKASVPEIIQSRDAFLRRAFDEAKKENVNLVPGT